MKKRLYLLFLCVLFLFCGCGKKEEAPEEVPIQKEEGTEKKEEDLLKGMALNPLTGLYIEEEAAKLRPVAVTINNLHKALPQSGLGQADIYYEVLAEGEITRIVALFQQFDAEKIGPVRSARSYFTYFALDNDAIYIHHGGSPSGYTAIANRGIDDLDGMVDSAFWRDKERANKPGMYEHSSYTDYESIMENWEEKGYRKNTKEQYEGMFRFAKEGEENSQSMDREALQVEVPYSYYQTSQFYYDEGKKEYLRYQSDAPQIDDLTGETLSVKNIILQYAPTYVVDAEGRREVDLVGEGRGLYISEGGAMEIVWRKDKYNTPTRWYDSTGKELRLNPGKTWICVYPEDGETVVITGKEEVE